MNMTNNNTTSTETESVVIPKTEQKPLSNSKD